MEIYVEKIVLLNVIIHLSIVFIVVYLTNNTINKKGLFIGSIIGVINLYLYFFVNIMYIHYICFFLIVLITFKDIKSTLLYLMLNFILGGISGVVNISINYYYEVIVACTLVIFLLVYLLKNKSDSYKIIINDNIYKCFYDTGCIINIGLTPIIIVNENLNLDLEFFTTIEINTIAGTTIHEVYKANNIYLLNNNKKIEKYCLIIISKIDYEVIVGKNFLGGI